MKHSVGFSTFCLGCLSLVVVVSGRSVYDGNASDNELVADASSYEEVGHPIEYKKGHGSEYESSHRSSFGEKGDKGYKNYHQQARSKIAHSDQSQHSGQDEEKGGHKKSYHDEDSKQHYGFHEEKDEKEQKYGKKGGFKKGHSTKGVHNVHKLNEYKKNKEFFDEDYEEENYEKHGGHNHKTGSDLGKSHKLGHQNKEFELGQYGKNNREENLYHHLEHLGKENRHGYHGYHGDEYQYGKKKNLRYPISWVYDFKGY